MTEMQWYQNAPPYNSTGAASAQMVLNYIREGAGASTLGQNQIYEYAKSPQPLVGELTPDEIDKVLGHFDPYDYLVSNWADAYDSYPDGNPYQGYNFTIDTYNPALNANAINEYMRDICHWMAYTVTKEDWWRDGELVARPNTPAIVPIFGTYNHWAVVKGYATSDNPCPQPRTNPYNTPDFTVYGFWIKDPLINGLGKDTYKTAEECSLTYFKPLSTSDSYNGLFVQIAEPPPYPSRANAKIARHTKNLANLASMGIQTKEQSGTDYVKRSWRDIVDPYILSDAYAVKAFENKRMGKPILVKRPDMKKRNYYLLPFGYYSKNRKFLATAVIILDASNGHFKEASWTPTPERFLKVDRARAMQLIRGYIVKNFFKDLKKKSYLKRRYLYSKYRRLLKYIYDSKAELIWQPGFYSPSPYKPYWRIDANSYIWYVTQDSKVIPETDIIIILKQIETSIRYTDELIKRYRKTSIQY